jgi:hypothetical protein
MRAQVALCLCAVLEAARGNEECDASSPHRFYDSANYPTYEAEADALFMAQYGKKAFGLEVDSLLPAHDGVMRTAAGHFEHMLAHIKGNASDDAPGWAKTGEREGVVYEMHAEATAAARGVGYFRLKADIACDARLFVALMADPKSLYDMDKTIR